MSDYYVQLDGDYLAAGRGDGTQLNPYNAAALDALLNGWTIASAAPGDRIFLRGTLALGRYHSLESVSVISGAFQSGDLAGDHPDPAQAGYRFGVVHQPSATSWRIYGDGDVPQGFTAWNYSREGQAVVSADIVTPGITLGVSGAATGGAVHLIGCPPDAWTPDGTRAVFDGESAAWNALVLAGQFTRLENIHFTRAVSRCVETSGSAYRNLLINCEASLAGAAGSGFYLPGGNYSHLIDCDAHGNGYYGAYLQQSSATRCRFADNGRQGVYAAYLVNLWQCLITGNGHGGAYEGLYISNDGGAVVGCAIDANAGSGVRIAAAKAGHCLSANRITANGAYGLSHESAAGGCVSDFNLYCANGSGALDGPDAGPGDLTDAESAGYVDGETGNYATADAAPARRMAASLPGGSANYLTAGLTPDDLRRDVQVEFPRHEVTFP